MRGRKNMRSFDLELNEHMITVARLAQAIFTCHFLHNKNIKTRSVNNFVKIKLPKSERKSKDFQHFQFLDTVSSEVFGKWKLTR